MSVVRRTAFITGLVVSLAALVSLATSPGAVAAAVAGCGAGANGSPGYAYAGHQSAVAGHGIRATITATEQPRVASGHAAGWIGVGGPSQARSGETMWLQAGIATIPGLGSFVYAEITRAGADPVFVPLVENAQVGQSYSLAVLEMASRPNSWRVWLNGTPVTEAIELPGSSGYWKPIATAESYNDTGTCNRFGYRFEQVAVAKAAGGAWKTFTPGGQFLDRGFAVKQLRPATADKRTLSADRILPYAFLAGSS